MGKTGISIFKEVEGGVIEVDRINRRLYLRESGYDLDQYPFFMKYKKRFYKVGYTRDVGYYTILGQLRM